MTTGPGTGPVTVTVAREVAPGREAEFEDWAADLTEAAARFPGFLGAGLLRPGHVGGEWHVVYRFETPEQLADWEQSTQRAALLARGQDLVERSASHRITGLETWFELPGRTAPAPPKWKMYLVAAAATWAVQVVINLSLGPFTGAWDVVTRLALFVGLGTAVTTWLVMPRAARLLQRWLYAPARRSRRR